MYIIFSLSRNGTWNDCNVYVRKRSNCVCVCMYVCVCVCVHFELTVYAAGLACGSEHRSGNTRPIREALL